MKKTLLIVILMSACWLGPVAGDAVVYGFDYNSNTGDDMAVTLTLKRCEADYEVSDNEDWDLERRTLIIGLSKTIQQRAKVFGSFNWGLDGEIDDLPYDLDHSYSVTGGGSYVFYDQNIYSISGFGQLEYTIEEEYEYSDADSTITFDGYEVLAGVLGKYNFHPNFSAYGILQFMLLSDLTGEAKAPGLSGEGDVERDNSFGFKIGGIYDQPSWFAKLELSAGIDRGFALTGGMKF